MIGNDEIALIAKAIQKPFRSSLDIVKFKTLAPFPMPYFPLPKQYLLVLQNLTST